MPVGVQLSCVLTNCSQTNAPEAANQVASELPHLRPTPTNSLQQHGEHGQSEPSACSDHHGRERLLGANAIQAADVIFEAGTKKAIRIENLDVGGTMYTAEFDVNSKPFQVYGDYPGTYAITSAGGADNAVNRMVSALFAEGATGVGETGAGRRGLLVRPRLQGGDQHWHRDSVGFTGPC